MTILTREQPYQVMPPLDDEQRHALRQSIQANGVLEPIVVDEDGNILDGHHRAEIAEALGIDYPTRVLAGLDEAGKLRYAITTNAVRRQLAPAQVSSMIANLRIKGMSIRQIAAATGMPKSSVSDNIRQLSELGQLEQPEKVTGADGRERPATRPAAQTPGPSDAAIATPPDGPGTTPDGANGATPAHATTADDPRADGGSPGSFAAPGAGEQPGRPVPPKWDPAERRQHEDEVQQLRDIEAGRRHAASIVTNLRGAVVTIVTAARLGEPDLVTADMIRELREAIDLLEGEL